MRGKDGSVLRQLNTLLCNGALRELTDGQLLERFSTGRGESRELAFEALVERHGGMVLRVCRAQLTDPHEIQDVFQATFLILVKKARGLWVRDSLGPWLHQVALRTAAYARSSAARRRTHERCAAELLASRGHEDPAASERERALHEEIDLLPECYRAAIVLCDLQGYTCEEAARRMGRPVGTVKCWRFRGRRQLRARLSRLELAQPAGLAAARARNAAREAALQATAGATARLAVRAHSELVTAGTVPASVQALVKGALKAMVIAKLRWLAGAVLALGVVTTGLGAVVWGVAEDSNRAERASTRAAVLRVQPEQVQQSSPAVNKPGESWPLTLREAIRIGLDNSDALRVIALGTTEMPLRIFPRDPRAEPLGFKAEAMAHLRAIEQRYWGLAQTRAALASAEKAADEARDVLTRKQADLAAGRGTMADVAEAAQRVKQLELDRVTRTSDVITTEGELRSVLGLPLVEESRIIPVTAPTEARLEPDWEACLAEVNANHPDVVRARARVNEAGADRSDEGLARLEERKAALQQAVHQATHSLARAFLEIDADYKQFKTASSLRAAAAQRLDAQRAYYEEGRITIDRFLDAVSQYANSVAQEAQYKTRYNVSIVALEEAKGTLLAYEHIAVAESPKPARITAGVSDAKARLWLESSRRMTQAPAPTVSQPTPSLALPPASMPGRPESSGEIGTSMASKAVSPEAGPAAKVLSFQMTVRIGSVPVEIRGSLSVTPLPQKSPTKAP
jgi:RNA polymerase sigma factor (sigma-70 family)